jgi:hypothetical protein
MSCHLDHHLFFFFFFQISSPLRAFSFVPKDTHQYLQNSLRFWDFLVHENGSVG